MRGRHRQICPTEGSTTGPEGSLGQEAPRRIAILANPSSPGAAADGARSQELQGEPPSQIEQPPPSVLDLRKLGRDGLVAAELNYLPTLLKGRCVS